MGDELLSPGRHNVSKLPLDALSQPHELTQEELMSLNPRAIRWLEELARRGKEENRARRFLWVLVNKYNIMQKELQAMKEMTGTGASCLASLYLCSLRFTVFVALYASVACVRMPTFRSPRVELCLLFPRLPCSHSLMQLPDLFDAATPASPTSPTRHSDAGRHLDVPAGAAPAVARSVSPSDPRRALSPELTRPGQKAYRDLLKAMQGLRLEITCTFLSACLFPQTKQRTSLGWLPPVQLLVSPL
jgi:hypothetical protein